MPHVKRIYMIIAGFSILVVTLMLFIIPRYFEVIKLSEAFEDRLSKLEEEYHRYVNQRKALDELRVVMKEPPDLRTYKRNGLRIEKMENGYIISGRTDGISLMEIMDAVVRSPSTYFEEINLSNSLENPITISGSTRSEADVWMSVKILELRE